NDGLTRGAARNMYRRGGGWEKSRSRGRRNFQGIASSTQKCYSITKQSELSDRTYRHLSCRYRRMRTGSAYGGTATGYLSVAASSVKCSPQQTGGGRGSTHLAAVAAVRRGGHALMHDCYELNGENKHAV